MANQRKSIRHLGSVTAFDQYGNGFLIHELVDVIHVQTLSGPKEDVLGMKSYRTGMNTPVNWISKGHYQIVGGPESPNYVTDVKSDHPDAF